MNGDSIEFEIAEGVVQESFAALGNEPLPFVFLGDPIAHGSFAIGPVKFVESDDSREMVLEPNSIIEGFFLANLIKVFFYETQGVSGFDCAIYPGEPLPQMLAILID